MLQRYVAMSDEQISYVASYIIHTLVMLKQV